MKLRNKKTGEIVNLVGVIHNGDRTFLQFNDDKGIFKHEYETLNQLNKEWEDYEEPSGYWYIDFDGDVLGCVEDFDEETDEKRKQIGNYFETKEEAEKAVEKLKAWKRLKNNGFKFQFWTSSYSGDNISFFIDWITADSKKEIEQDLDLLFGGEV